MIPSLYTALQQNNDFGLLQSNVKYSVTLGAASDTTLTVPGSSPKWKAIIKVEPAGLVWFAMNATAAVPAGATIVASNSEMVTGDQYICREVKAGDVMHFITASANTDVSIVFYAIYQN